MDSDVRTIKNILWVFLVLALMLLAILAIANSLKSSQDSADEYVDCVVETEGRFC